MSDKILTEISRLESEIKQASSELYILGNEYDEKRREIQNRLTVASGQLTAVLAFSKRGQEVAS